MLNGASNSRGLHCWRVTVLLVALSCISRANRVESAQPWRCPETFKLAVYIVLIMTYVRSHDVSRVLGLLCNFGAGHTALGWKVLPQHGCMLRCTLTAKHRRRARQWTQNQPTSRDACLHSRCLVCSALCEALDLLMTSDMSWDGLFSTKITHTFSCVSC